MEQLDLLDTALKNEIETLRSECDSLRQQRDELKEALKAALYVYSEVADKNLNPTLRNARAALAKMEGK